MIISRKRYEKNIEEAVQKALYEADRRKWTDDRFNAIERRLSELDTAIRWRKENGGEQYAELD